MNEEKQESTVLVEQFLCALRFTCRNPEVKEESQPNNQSEEKKEGAEKTPSELPPVKQEQAEGSTVEQETSVKSESKEAATENAAGASQEADQPVLDEEEIKTIDPLSRCMFLAPLLPIKTTERFRTLSFKATTSTMVTTAFSPALSISFFISLTRSGA